MKLVTPIIQQEVKKLPFYVTRCCTNYLQNKVVRTKGFTEYQIIQAVGGEGTFTCGDNTYEIKKGDIVGFAPKIPHKYDDVSKWELNWVCFVVNDNNSMIKELFKDGAFILKNATDLNSKFLAIVNTLTNDSQYNQFKATALLYDIFIDLLAIVKKLPANTREYSPFDDTISYMQENLQREITIEELSNLIGVSPSYYCRKFKQLYQVTPVQYLINLRMAKARNYLVNDSIRIKDIAEKCGYYDTAYFCREFKKFFCLSPNQYRKKLYN